MHPASIPLYIPPANTYFVTTKQEGQYLSILYISKPGLSYRRPTRLNLKIDHDFLCCASVKYIKAVGARGVRGGVMTLQLLTNQLSLSQPGGGGGCPPHYYFLPTPNFKTFLWACKYISSRLHVILYIPPPLDVRLNTTILNTKRRFLQCILVMQIF